MDAMPAHTTEYYIQLEVSPMLPNWGCLDCLHTERPWCWCDDGGLATEEEQVVPQEGRRL
jgi:hypothetical protein